ncbi:cerberus [Pseudophryne corroboree]|uniref:cerberus n=1 Tax=Pseudophryne corroboree TaxID=495146 RepID=UPI003081DE52
MLFQILQLIVIFYVAIDAEGRHVKARGRTKHHMTEHQQHSGKGKETSWNFVLHDTFLEKEHAKSEVSENNPEKNKASKLKLLAKDSKGVRTVQTMDLSRMTGHSRTRKNSFSAHSFNIRNVDVHEKYAKKSWDYFVYKLNGATEDFIYPVKTQEIQQEVCKTVPFFQKVIHENCDKLVIQNNLCFGICNSLYVPNQRDQLNICSHCQPFKFTMNHLTLNCTGSSNVVKVIMMVEECKCVVHRYIDHGTVFANIGVKSYGNQ